VLRAVVEQGLQHFARAVGERAFQRPLLDGAEEGFDVLVAHVPQVRVVTGEGGVHVGQRAEFFRGAVLARVDDAVSEERLGWVVGLTAGDGEDLRDARVVLQFLGAPVEGLFLLGVGQEPLDVGARVGQRHVLLGHGEQPDVDVDHGLAGLVVARVGHDLVRHRAAQDEPL
jgi:hypothetical protein